MSLAKAIIEKWNNSAISSLVPGGLWREFAGEHPTFPYQTFTILGETHDGYTSTSTRRLAMFEIQTYVKGGDSTDPQEALDALVLATEEAFHDQSLTITGKDAVVVTLNDSRTFEEDSQVYRGICEFDLTTSKVR